MIYPRFIARFVAWFLGYFWMPCPVCKEPFAGFEVDPGVGTVMDSSGANMFYVCSKPACAAERRKQLFAGKLYNYTAWTKHPRDTYADGDNPAPNSNPIVKG